MLKNAKIFKDTRVVSLWYVTAENDLKSIRLLIFISAIFLVACSGQSGGVAPSNQTVPTVTPPNDESLVLNRFKYGEVTTNNGWEITFDSTDPVETTSLPNGWQVQVRYE